MTNHLLFDSKFDTSLRVRLGGLDTHYRNYLIPAATILRLFADCSTSCLITSPLTACDSNPIVP